MRFSNPTVRHSSTKNFRRDGNLRAQILPELDSEPQAPRLSSVKDVTATVKVQTREQFLSQVGTTNTLTLTATKQRVETGDGNYKLRTENWQLPFALTPLRHLYLPFAITLSTESGAAIFHAQAYIPT